VGIGIHLGLGLAMVGLAGYAFVAVVGQVFAGTAGGAELSALTSLYLLVNIIGPGLFSAVEPETSRAVSARLAMGHPIRPVVRRVGRHAARILAALLVVLAALWPLGLGRVLAHDLALAAALALAAVGAAALYTTRGVLSGQRRFAGYAGTLYLEGLARLVPCLVLLMFLVREPAAYGFAFASGALVAALAMAPALHLERSREPAPPVAGIGRSLSFLMTATLLSQAVANLAPVVVTYRTPDDLVVASAFAVSFVLARVPLMLFSPIQAVLLPHLTRAAEVGRMDTVRLRMRQVLLAVIAIGLPSVIAGVLLGPWAARTLFGVTTPPSGAVFGLLGFAAVLIMAALVLQPALIALRSQRTVMVAWVAGTAVFLVTLVAPLDPVVAALLAQLLGPTVVLAIAGSRLRALIRMDQARPAA
jgi:O-antigen/teichoic acid export membrane protein